MKASLNKKIAAQLDEVATLLEQQDANTFRIASYRKAADTLRGLSKSVADIIDQEGSAGLEKLPGIGEGLSRSISTLAETGHLPLLDRLRGESNPQKILMSLPGVGPKLAERLHEELGIDSLADVEAAAHDGRLKKIGGFGEKRIAGIRDVLARRLSRTRSASASVQHAPIDELLDVDREYRRKAKAGKLHQIAPRRFNPKHEAWLPVLHTRRGNREYTALFSNTKRAHELEMTQDWVVIYSEEDSREQTSTVVTESRGKLKGRRVVRGREDESAAYHQDKK
jgi:DNA polymerase/3'-5' exonuclease PolX